MNVTASWSLCCQHFSDTWSKGQEVRGRREADLCCTHDISDIAVWPDCEIFRGFFLLPNGLIGTPMQMFWNARVVMNLLPFTSNEKKRHFLKHFMLSCANFFAHALHRSTHRTHWRVAKRVSQIPRKCEMPHKSWKDWQSGWNSFSVM